MKIKLTEEERSVWRDLYTLHEQVHDMSGTTGEWIAFAENVGLLSQKYRGAAGRLMWGMLLALYDYMSKEQKIREDADRVAPQQLRLEDIPWD